MSWTLVNTTRSEIRLRNGIVIAIHSNSFRLIRGRTLLAAILDECAFWRSEDELNQILRPTPRCCRVWPLPTAC